MFATLENSRCFFSKSHVDVHVLSLSSGFSLYFTDCYLKSAQFTSNHLNHPGKPKSAELCEYQQVGLINKELDLRSLSQVYM